MTLLFLTTTAIAANLEVSTSGMSLDEAVVEANPGDTLWVLDGSWNGVTVDTDITVIAMSPSVSIASLKVVGGADVTVQSVELGSVRVEHSTLSLYGLVFSDGAGPAISVQDGTVLADQISIQGRDGVVLQDSVFDAVGLDMRSVSGTDGAAIRGDESEVVVRGSVFRNTAGSGYGGAIFLEGGSLLVEDCDFGASEAWRGGHIATSNADAEIKRSVFANGKATDRGGSLYVLGGEIRISEVDWSDNVAKEGGAMALDQADVVARDITALNGRAESGAAVWAEGAQVDLTRTTFADGRADTGGALALYDSGLWAENGFWLDTEWALVGGALYMDGGDSSLHHILVAGNQAEVGSGLAIETGDMSLSGVIVYGNGTEGVVNAGGTLQSRHSISFANFGSDRLGRVDGSLRPMDPMFVGPDHGDWALSTASPAIDVGVAGLTDPDGSPADMGAFGGPSAWRLPDTDQDGHVYGRDCDDRNPDTFPGAFDAWYDGVDSDCAGNDDFDADRDGWPVGEDCDENDPAVNPGAAEISGDRIDSDCDGRVDVDADGDGWTEYVDCDDNDPSAFPGSEINDCDEPEALDAEVASWPEAPEADTDPASPSHRVQSVEFSDEPPSMMVSTGCSSTAAHPTFLAALLALVGLLLPRRRS